MKQKRKVKGQKFTESNKFLASLLVLLGGAFCMGALSLFTVPNVWGQTSLTTLSYTGLESKNEVVYDMFFIDKGNQEIINEIYMKKDGDNRNFYISGNSVVLGNLLPNYEGLDKVSVLNLVGEGKYSNILGGDHNNINSSNITIIAGVSNAISEGNDNATIVGSAGSSVSTGGGNVPLVLVGGLNNEIGSNQNGTVIIGGNGNKIFDNVSNSQILGGNGNKVAVDNVIVAGNNVEATPSGEGSFVFNGYSTEVFRPNSTNSFFLNVEKGVGLNMEASNGGLASKGAISIGEIDKSMCTSDNIGMQGVWSGCLVGCTKESTLELLDTSEGCLELFVKPRKIKPRPPKEGVCYSGGVDTGHATICGDPTGYLNAVFEVELIDAHRDTGITCPNGDNQCVYQCNDGYHLVNGKCHKDCDLPWNSSYIKHGQTVTGYSSPSTTCTTTCSSYEMILTCNDGVLYDSNGRENKDYTNEDCVLNNKVCSETKYPFTSCPEHGICKPEDGGQCDEYKAEGKYQCIYTSSRFQLTDCDPGYTFVDEGGVRSCKKNCDYNGRDVEHGGQRSPYTSNGGHCTKSSDGCSYKTIICDDGDWYLSPKTSNIKAGDFSVYCSYDDKKCDLYTISQAEKDAGEKEGKKYKDCQKLNGGEQCTLGDIVYMEDGCDDNHWLCRGSCIPNCGEGQHEYSITCSCVDDEPETYLCGGTEPSGDGVSKGSSSYTEGYTPTSWTYKSSGTLGACQWRCSDGYEQSGNGCKENEPETYLCGGTEPSGDGVSKGSSSYTEGYTPTSWTYKSSGTLGACQWRCSDGYEQSGNGCKEKEKSVCALSCGSTFDNCRVDGNSVGNGSNQGSEVSKNGEGYYTWTCFGGGKPSGCDEVDPTPPLSCRCDTKTCSDYGLSSTNPGNYESVTKDSGCGSDKKITCYKEIQEYDCQGTEPGSYTTESNEAPTSNKNWEYKSSGTLGACQWRCQDSNYERDGSSTNCKPKTYSCGGTEPSGDGVSKGGTTYTYGNTPTSWTYKSSGTLGDCEWRCDSDYEKDGDTGCKYLTYTCEAGKYLPANSTSCASCTAGYYCPGGTWSKSSSDQGINKCSCGTYSKSGASSCTDCGDGKYSTAGSSSCSRISCGYYGSSACSATPNKCASGKYSVAGSSSCSNCESGKQPSSDQCSCVASCPAGYVEEIGLQSARDCGDSGEDGWELTINGTANGWNCVKCEKKSCPNNFSTICDGQQQGYEGDSPCYSCGGGSSGGDTCDSYYEFNPSWAPWGSGPAESTANNLRCESDAGAGWDCSYSNYEPGHASMCECSRSAQCQSCTKPWNSETISHGESITAWNASSSSNCKSETRTCDNGTLGGSYMYQKCDKISSGGGGGGGGCFLAGTQVHMADGATKNIEDIEVGDMVLTYNTETKQNEYNKVLKKYVHENNTDNLYEFTINGNVLTVTAPHRFYVVLDENDGYKCPYNWVPASRLKVGYDLLMYDGSIVTIEDKVRYSHYGTVYNLLVENNNNYYVAEGYLVHNLNGLNVAGVQEFSSCGAPGGCGDNDIDMNRPSLEVKQVALE